MPEDFSAAYQAVLQAVADGTIDQDRINDSLLRIYRIKYKDLLATISIE
jgi:beta-N-acetylhexosaminidase